MATIHHHVRFEVPPTLEAVRKKVRERTGLKVILGRDAIEAGHEFPDLGAIKEAGALECDEAGDSDLDITVGARGVRIDVVEGTNLYFRDVVLGALEELGGKSEHPPGPLGAKKWAQLTPAEREESFGTAGQ